MTLRKGLKLWAIGGKTWIEFRSGRVAPKPHIDVVTKIVPITQSHLKWFPNNPEDRYAGGVYRRIDRTIQKKFDLKTTTFSGGRVLGTTPRHRKTPCPIDQVVEVPAEHIAGILEELEKKSSAAA